MKSYPLSRRHFLRGCLVGLGGVVLAACRPGETPATPPPLRPTKQPAATAPAMTVSATPQPRPKNTEGGQKSNPTKAAAQPTPTAQASATAQPASSPAGLEILLGRPTAVSVTASLLSTTDCQVVLAYGAQPGEVSQQTGPVQLKANLPQNLEITGLQANTRYAYHVLTGSTTSTAHAFQTQRTPGSSFTFTIDADPHNRDPRFDGELYRRTLANILADKPDFHVNLGDTFMTEKLKPASQADVGRTITDMRPYFGTIGMDVPLYLVNGNHEGELGWLLRSKDKDLPVWSVQMRQQYYPNPRPDAFYTGSATTDPTLGAPRDGYYAWTWGDALLVVLDPFWYTLQKPAQADLSDNWNWTLGQEQYRWLAATLAASKSRYKFVFIHHLVGGSGEARGGIEFARLFEWGGSHIDGKYAFDVRRPGWGKPIHQLLVDARVSAVFHGHDHVFVKQALDGVIYQELPQPNIADYSNTSMAAEYGYKNGDIRSSSGHLRVSVSASQATVEYIRAFLPKDEKTGRVNGQSEGKYTL